MMPIDKQQQMEDLLERARSLKDLLSESIGDKLLYADVERKISDCFIEYFVIATEDVDMHRWQWQIGWDGYKER